MARLINKININIRISQKHLKKTFKVKIKKAIVRFRREIQLMNPQQNIKKFKVFLEEKIFCAPLTSFKKINRGGSSFNFLAQYAQNSYLIKLLPKDNMPRIERLCQILSFFSRNPDFTTPHLVKEGDACGFDCGDYRAVVLNYIPGRKIKFFELSKAMLNPIIAAYKIFQSLEWENQSFILPQRSVKEIYNSNKLKIEELRQANKGFFQQKLLAELDQINQSIYSSTVLPDCPPAVIHGDASLNNMIIDQNGKAVFLDFEMVRHGFIIEDVTEFIFAAVLPHYVFLFPKRMLLKIMTRINQNRHFSKQEWLYGTNLYFLYLIQRRLNGTKFLKSFRKDFLFLTHLKKHQKIVDLIEKKLPA